MKLNLFSIAVSWYCTTSDCYYFHNIDLSFAEARAFCQRMDADLPVIRSEEQVNNIIIICKKYKYHHVISKRCMKYV